jgi:hypothetical protein
VPAIDFVMAEDENWAIKLAIDRLESSTYYEAIEVFEDDALRFRIVAANSRPETPGSQIST